MQAVYKIMDKEKVDFDHALAYFLVRIGRFAFNRFCVKNQICIKTAIKAHKIAGTKVD